MSCWTLCHTECAGNFGKRWDFQASPSPGAPLVTPPEATKPDPPHRFECSKLLSVTGVIAQSWPVWWQAQNRLPQGMWNGTIRRE